jgi:hypothetical protein
VIDESLSWLVGEYANPSVVRILSWPAGYQSDARSSHFFSISIPCLWNITPARIGYAHLTYDELTNEERMQRESNLVATIWKRLH